MCHGAFRAAMGRGPYDYLTLPLLFLLGGIFIVENRKQKGIYFKVSEKERDLIEQKMALLGTANMAAYLRKMAIDGYIVNLDLPELRELISLLRRFSNNLNQLTKRVHKTGRFYDADLDDLKQSFERLWDMADKLLNGLAKIK